MAPKGAKRAGAAPPAAQNESGKRRRRAGGSASGKKKETASEEAGPARRILYERHGGAAAVAAAAAAAVVAGQSDSESGSGSEEQACTCGECLDGWLSPAFSSALAQAAAEAREDVERVQHYVEQEGFPDDKPLRGKRLAKALSQTGALRVLSRTDQLMIDFLRVYGMLLQGIEDLLGEGTPPYSEAISCKWDGLVEDRVRALEERHLRSVRDGNQDAQTEVVAYLIRRARKELDRLSENEIECNNDTDYAGVAEEMLGLARGEGDEWIAADSDDSGSGSDGSSSESDGDEEEEEEGSEYDEEEEEEETDEEYYDDE